jgi:hypothetical protein
MNVMIIPEDFRLDQFILQPIIVAMLADLGKPRAKVEVCLDPLLGGIDRALDPGELAEIIVSRPMIDLFLLCVDRDLEEGRRAKLNNLETALQPKVKRQGGAFLAENAWQEIEVWTIAGHDLLPGWQWADIRAERDPKERYFEALAQKHGLHGHDDGGRKILGAAAARRYARIHQRCPEDVRVLHERVKSWLAGQGTPDWNTAFSLYAGQG